MKNNLLDHVGYHEKWHGKDQKQRPTTKYSINEKIIEFIFKKLNIGKGNFVEFGAWDGILNSNARNLFLNGWGGLFIESDPDRFSKLFMNYKNEKNIFLSETHLDTMYNLLDYEIENSINDQIDFMSIDIDGLDLEIFKTIHKFLPTVLCIEGGQILEPYHKIVDKTISKKNIQQSLFQMNKIIESKGYKLVCAYQDAFFILESQFHNLKIIQKDIFTHYVNGLLAYPRIPYIKLLLDEVKIGNRIIDYIIEPLDLLRIDEIAKYGKASEKAEWVDNNFSIIESKLNELKNIRLEFPYDEHNETLWEEVSKF